MGLIENIREHFRYELPVEQEIVERERKRSKDRTEWLLNYIQLYEQGLKELARDGIHVYFPTEKSRQPKKVKVGVKKVSNEQIAIQRLEEKLKFAIHYRDCNLGVNYRRYEEGKYLVGEATPAICGFLIDL